MFYRKTLIGYKNKQRKQVGVGECRPRGSVIGREFEVNLIEIKAETVQGKGSSSPDSCCMYVVTAFSGTIGNSIWSEIPSFPPSEQAHCSCSLRSHLEFTSLLLNDVAN